MLAISRFLFIYLGDIFKLIAVQLFSVPTYILRIKISALPFLFKALPFLFLSSVLKTTIQFLAFFQHILLPCIAL
ncbi:hypothetical protein K450DRAFT_245864 [Umbelopsis ramanniana AG]|uniref:Uncharacterized protein n=1 Tax=Umbelopsis ramanniana AG TaxID=1314678 RepID=A0AAD5HDZ0_UMBRA|nr:uncharacterized protein K450DRAFT_245864 [Umbelopsis ramanniana AG]KAI8578643.1 hypothetical protein K450DRAFT_245864 [Umbelopsis ramanniana AG]